MTIQDGSLLPDKKGKNPDETNGRELSEKDNYDSKINTMGTPVYRNWDHRHKLYCTTNSYTEKKMREGDNNLLKTITQLEEEDGWKKRTKREFDDLMGHSWKSSESEKGVGKE